MAREDLHFRLRIPDELKRKIEAEAEQNHRSMTAEIVARLNDSFERLADERVAELEEELTFLRGKTEGLAHTLRIFLSHLGKSEEGTAVILEEILRDHTGLPPKAFEKD